MKKPEEVIVTYGEDWSVGKEMLTRAFMKWRPGVTRDCRVCRHHFEAKKDVWECDHCAALPDDQRIPFTY